MEAFIEKNENDTVAKQIAKQLHSFIGIKYRALDAQVDIMKEFIAKVEKDDPFFAQEYHKLVNVRNEFKTAYEGLGDSHESEYETFASQISSIVNSNMKDLFNTFGEYERTHTERDRIYHHFVSSGSAEQPQSEYLDAFRNSLLQHLAGNIIVKENRNRYQKEQFDRYVASCINPHLKKTNVTLEQFCQNYAMMIDSMVDESHNFRSPKIEANYDDFAQKTIRPINSTIFYYFFSADRRKRTIAQWLLSAIRFPNERMRRAYMRFFA